MHRWCPYCSLSLLWQNLIHSPFYLTDSKHSHNFSCKSSFTYELHYETEKLQRFFWMFIITLEEGYGETARKHCKMLSWGISRLTTRSWETLFSFFFGFSRSILPEKATNCVMRNSGEAVYEISEMRNSKEKLPLRFLTPFRHINWLLFLKIKGPSLHLHNQLKMRNRLFFF